MHHLIVKRFMFLLTLLLLGAVVLFAVIVV